MACPSNCMRMMARIAVVRDQSRHHLVERIGDGEHAVEVLEGADRVVDRRGVRLVVARSSPSAVTITICALVPLACGNERPSCWMPAWDSVPGIEKELSVPFMNSGGAAARDAEQQKPGDQHAPRVSVRPTPERIEDGGHGSLRVDRFDAPVVRQGQLSTVSIRRCIQYIDVS